MLLAALVEAFDLPPDSRIDQRVPKKMLVEHGARTAADKRLILDCLDEVRWLAALKPNSVGIAAYRDDAREYLEIALIAANLQGDRSTPARQARLAELIHRAVPYPVVLLAQAGTALELSLAHKRRAHNDTGKVVLDGERLGLCFTDGAPEDAATREFARSLALSGRPHAHLYALYQYWMDAAWALCAARHSGRYRLADNPAQALARRQALDACRRLRAEAARLRARAKKEKQIARQVELNLQLKELEAQLAAKLQQL